MKSKTGPALFAVDEHVRPNASLATLAKLRPVFDRTGTVSTVLQGPFSVQELDTAVQKVA